MMGASFGAKTASIRVDTAQISTGPKNADRQTDGRLFRFIQQIYVYVYVCMYMYILANVYLPYCAGQLDYIMHNVVDYTLQWTTCSYKSLQETTVMQDWWNRAKTHNHMLSVVLIFCNTVSIMPLRFKQQELCQNKTCMQEILLHDQPPMQLIAILRFQWSK